MTAGTERWKGLYHQRGARIARAADVCAAAGMIARVAAAVPDDAA